VISAAVSDFGLLGQEGGSPVHVEGYTRKPADDPYVPWTLIGPRFFQASGTPLLLGRDFSDRDTDAAPHAAIVNESFARAYLPGQNPIGKRFGMRRDTDYPWEIVGVVRDVKKYSLRDSNLKMVYLPYRQDPAHLYSLCVVARLAESSPGTLAGIRGQLHEIDPNLPISSVETGEERLDEALAQERLIAGLSGFFGALALLLACIGLYGLMSYTAARRTSEIGIRLALGATRADVVGMVLSQCFWLVAAGTALGIPAVLGAGGLIEANLFGVHGADPRTIAGAAALLLAVAILAAGLPAIRASKVDPLRALRYD
jgi:predicted permease